ncbi:hypothetical protein ACLBX9_13135 [Methylobacterium sp. A49B]
MGDVLTFAPRPKPNAPESPEPLASAEPRAQLEAGVQAALDVADHFNAVLNGMDGCPDLEDGDDTEPSLAAPGNTGGSQVVDMRGGDQDREEEVSETTLHELAVEGLPPLPWGGRGNVLAAAGAARLDLMSG